MINEDFRSKRHNLQVVELSQRSQTAVQIVLNLPAPSNGDPIYLFWTSRPCGPAGWLALFSLKRVMSRLIQVRQHHTNESGFVISAIKQIHVRKQISISATGLNTGCTSDVQISAKHNTQIPGPVIYTNNPDSQLTQT